MSSNLAIARRDFLKLAGAAAAAGVTHTALAVPRPHIAILLDTTDPTIRSDTSRPVKVPKNRFRDVPTRIAQPRLSK